MEKVLNVAVVLIAVIGTYYIVYSSLREEFKALLIFLLYVGWGLMALGIDAIFKKTK